MLLVDGGSTVIVSEMAMCDRGEFWVVWGRAHADWVNLHYSSSNFHKNWNAVSSLVVKDRCVSPGGGCGAVIASKMAMFN